MKLDPQDRAALAALDSDFVVSPDGEVAKIVGEMAVKVIRVSDDRLQMTLDFPGGEEFVIRLARAQLLDQFDFKADDD